MQPGLGIHGLCVHLVYKKNMAMWLIIITCFASSALCCFGFAYPSSTELKRGGVVTVGGQEMASLLAVDVMNLLVSSSHPPDPLQEGLIPQQCRHASFRQCIPTESCYLTGLTPEKDHTPQQCHHAFCRQCIPAETYGLPGFDPGRGLYTSAMP